MNVLTPIDRVAEFLAAAGFRRLGMPLEIAGVKFDFPIGFIGSPPSPDLILVVDTAFDNEHRILKRVEGLPRALDVVASKRPLTVVVAGPRPHSGTLEAMSKVCRVLPIGTVLDEDPDAVLKNWLAVLTPLNLPEPNANIADPLSEIAMHVEDLHPDVGSLVQLASQGPDAVQSRLHEIIDKAMDGKSYGDTP